MSKRQNWLVFSSVFKWGGRSAKGGMAAEISFTCAVMLISEQASALSDVLA